MRRYRFIHGILLAALAVMLLAVPVLAAYYAEITVTESDGNSYDMLPVIADIDIDYLADNNFIEPDGRDVRIKTGSGAEVPFMLVDDKVLFAAPIANDRQNAFRFSTGNSLIDDYAIVTGDGGYVTIADHTNLELSDDFAVEFSGYIDTTVNQNLVTKADNFNIWTDTDGTVNAEIPYYVYYEGYYDPTIDWEEGYINGEGVFTEESNCLRARAHRTSGTNEASGVTSVTVDLTDVSTIYIDWSASTTGAGGSTSFVVSTVQISSAGTYDAKIADGVDRSREIDTLDVSGLTGEYYLRLHARATSGTGYVYNNVYGVWYDTGDYFTPSGSFVSAADVSSGEHVVKVYTTDSDFNIDIDGETEDTATLLASYMNNDNNYVVDNLPYCDYFKLTTSDTLRLTYDPDDIISGTTLINETDAGTYDGTITYGSNPAGITVNMYGLETYETSYPTDAAGSQDIIRPTTAPLFDVDLDKLSHNPMQPIVALIADTTNLTERLVWLADAFVLLFVILLVVLWKTEGQITFTAFAGLGFCIIAYILGIFPLWTIIVFAIGAVASLIWERVIAL